ncbi:MAG: single-stranded DNA-binding protein [Thermodesulfobacteriota bacterium]
MGARSMNKVLLIGRLGRDPEVRYTASGKAVATFSLATDYRWKDQDGNDQERTEWHRVVAWGRTGEVCGQYLSKGRQVFVEGRIQSRDWEDQDGNKRTTVEIVANDVIMLGGRGESEDASYGNKGRGSGAPEGRGREGSAPPQDRRPAPSSRGDRRPGPGDGNFGPPPPEEEIPF